MTVRRTKHNARMSGAVRWAYRIMLAFAIAIILIEFGLHLAVALWSGLPEPASAISSYGAAFEREEQAVLDSMTIRDELRWIGDFHGQYINVINNFRITTDQPRAAKHTLWLFGSSTVLCLQVPDAFTLASYLQRMIGNAYRVQNMGVTSANSGTQLRLLKQADMHPGDIVIFYDGAQDEISPYYITLNRRGTSICQRLMPILEWSILFRAACLNTPTIWPDASLTADVYRRYALSITEAMLFARQRGATFYHFLQPTIYDYPAREDERALLQDFGPVMRASAELFRTTPDTGDLSHALDLLRGSGAKVYLDWVHLTAQGNEAIARAIYAALFKAF